jgi:hypothetical protein
MNKLVIDGREISIDEQLRDLDRVDCEDDLYSFLKYSWRYIDSSEFTDGWPIQAVADHLQAVTDGDIKRLIINIPPRCAKSSLTSVAFPAWTWAQPWNGHTSGPGVQFLHASYAQQLSLRDSVKCRRLIESPWYQQLWGDRFRLTGDQNTKTRFDNDKGGSRLSTSVGSALTGEGGSIIVVDDPNAAQEAFSEATIHSTIEWWDSALSTRLNDPKQGAFVVIQQRLSEEDLTGHILSKDVGEWTHLCLPMRYEWQRHSYSSIGWHDPRGLDEMSGAVAGGPAAAAEVGAPPAGPHVYGLAAVGVVDDHQLGVRPDRATDIRRVEIALGVRLDEGRLGPFGNLVFLRRGGRGRRFFGRQFPGTVLRFALDIDLQRLQFRRGLLEPAFRRGPLRIRLDSRL